MRFDGGNLWLGRNTKQVKLVLGLLIVSSSLQPEDMQINVGEIEEFRLKAVLSLGAEKDVPDGLQFRNETT